MTNVNVRKLAYDILVDIFINEAYSNISLNKHFNNNKLEIRDKKYITEIVYGTVKNKLYLEFILKGYTKGRVKPKVKILLIMSLYQILYMTKTPDFAVVNESVKIAKDSMGNITAKFINGALRNFIRSFDNKNLTYKNEKEKICIEQSFPIELYNIIEKQYGRDKTNSIVKSFTTKSDNSLRVNSLKTTREKLNNYFLVKGVESRFSKICEDNIIVNSLDINDESFKQGFYTIQDEASSLVGCVINEDIKKNYKILDVCAAPGGKSLHIASKYFNSNLTSCDKYIHKLSLIKNNAERLGIKNINVIENDATKINEDFINNFDIVVCDVPCSGLGVIKNKPEIKYRINDSDINSLSALQLKILEVSKSYVKKDGLLIYSTCTIDKRENINNIKQFLTNNANFSLEKIDLNGSIVKESTKGILNILPDEYQCDGFFIAKLRKMED